MAIFRYGQFSIWQNSVSTLAKIHAIGQIFIVVNIEQLIKAFLVLKLASRSDKAARQQIIC